MYCRDFREVRLLEQQACFLEVLEVEFLRGVVQVDVFVGGGVFRVSRRPRPCWRSARELVCEHFLSAATSASSFDFRCEGGGHFNERFVGSAQMLLLPRERDLLPD
ncbi:MAG: hypothetical protein ACLT98_04700 [Eggerthellaceae bacterium]